MVVAIATKSVSPVNMEERKKLALRSGDVVRVHQKIREKGKIRIQIFEGLVLAKKHGSEAGATFTVRATMSGIGVEKIFPLYSPMIDKIEIVRRATMRRAKLYYIRDKATRDQRKKLRQSVASSLSTKSEREVAEAASQAAAAEVVEAAPEVEETKEAA